MPFCFSCGGNTFIPRVPGDKFRAGSGPASVQPDEVASVLQNIELDLEDYEAEICRLRREKGRLEHYAAQLRSLQSPFRKIPNEILRKIFDDCCDMNSFRAVDLKRRLPTHTAQALRSKPAMVISFVCSRWRQNALSIPAIWSRISLYWDIHGEDNNWEDEDMEIAFPLSNFLNRSQRHPMMVNLDLVENPVVRGRGLHPLLKQLFGQMVRWECLSFRYEHHYIKYILDHAGIPSASFPVLRSLCILETVMDGDLIPFMNASPNLQTLDLPSRSLIISQKFNHPQRSREDFDPEEIDIQNIFDKCSNLLSLGLAESSLYNNAAAPMTIPCSSKLEILTVCHCDEYWDNSWDSSDSPLLKLPSLKSLYLIWEKCKTGPSDNHILYHDDDILDDELKSWSNLESFVVFVKQSAFQLTTFSVQRLSISDADLVGILLLLPTLQDLTVDNSGISPKRSPISPEFVDSLHAHRFSSLRPQGPCVIPRLRSLRLLNLATPTFRDLSVVEMVKSRWTPAKLHAVGTSAFEVDCLRVFTMTFLNRLETEAGVYHSLEPIERNGMMIVTQMGRKTLWT